MQNERDIQFEPSEGLSGIEEPSGREEIEGKAHEAADRIKEKAEDVRERATDAVEGRLSERKHRAATSLGSVAQSLRSAGQQLPTDDGMGHYIVRAADQVDHFANYMESRDLTELVDGVENFARRQPGAFIGGAFALGVVGARFLKSSRRDLVSEGVREGWNTRELTNRVEEPQDAVSRPGAPGYEPPAERGVTGEGGDVFR